MCLLSGADYSAKRPCEKLKWPYEEGGKMRVRSMRTRYLKRPTFSAKHAALAVAAGHTIDSSPPSQAFMVAVSSHSWSTTTIHTKNNMPEMMTDRCSRADG